MCERYMYAGAAHADMAEYRSCIQVIVMMIMMMMMMVMIMIMMVMMAGI